MYMQLPPPPCGLDSMTFIDCTSAYVCCFYLVILNQVFQEADNMKQETLVKNYFSRTENILHWIQRGGEDRDQRSSKTWECPFHHLQPLQVGYHSASISSNCTSQTMLSLATEGCCISPISTLIANFHFTLRAEFQRAQGSAVGLGK